MENPDGHGYVKGSCGDSVEIFVKLGDGRVERSSYFCHGCRFTMACASAAASLIEGRTIAEARRSVSPAAIASVVGELPDDHEHCAALATYCVHEALDDAVRSEREPWRKAYRRQNEG